MSPEPIDIHDVVDDALDELALAHPARTMKHVRASAGECSGDPNRLAQMIGNLVSNAVVYSTPETLITVTSTVDTTSYSIAVHNEGVAIPAEIRESLFRPMTRGAKAARSGRSVGLGLFIVREIARAHGGTAVVTSTADGGTSFTATFPRPPPAEPRPA